jgi:hypothetical protein
MKKFLPIITIGFLILSGIGAAALTSDVNEFDSEPVDLKNTNSGSRDSTHTVFGTYGTATWCGYCKYAHGALKELYAEGALDFFYVSLVCDMNTIAYSHASNDYNLYGYPTLWWDGGYKVDVGAGSIPAAKSTYTSSINQAGARPVEDIDIDLSVAWLGGTEMKIDASVTNNEGATYGGHVRVFITEIVSSMGWYDTAGQLYTFTFLDFAFNEPLSLSAGGSWSDSMNWDGSSHGYSSITEDNIMVIAVVYNDEWHQGYSYPPSSNPFDAYYVDECVGVVPGGGGTGDPPETPSAPTGPSEGIEGVEYSFSASTIDPNGDDILYQFDWGNGVHSGWYGPETSGVAVDGSYIWTEAGTYDVRVRAKDDNGSSESAWSAPATITILEGVSLDISEIQGGLLKVATTIDNLGGAEATDVSWNIAMNGGFLLLNGGTSGTFASIPAGGSQEISSKLTIGFGKITIMVTCEMVDGPSDSRQQGATVLLFLISMSPGGGI